MYTLKIYLTWLPIQNTAAIVNFLANTARLLIKKSKTNIIQERQIPKPKVPKL